MFQVETQTRTPRQVTQSHRNGSLLRSAALQSNLCLCAPPSESIRCHSSTIKDGDLRVKHKAARSSIFRAGKTLHRPLYSSHAAKISAPEPAVATADGPIGGDATPTRTGPQNSPRRLDGEKSGSGSGSGSNSTSSASRSTGGAATCCSPKIRDNVDADLRISHAAMQASLSEIETKLVTEGI